MRYLILSLIMVSQSSFATLLAEQITDARGYVAAVGSNPLIRAYMTGRAPATEAVFVEILRFAEAMDTRQVGLNDKGNEILSLAEDAGNELVGLSPGARDQVRPIMTSLLAQYPARSKNEILLRIFNRFWLWGPEHLDFMARKVRNDGSHLISTQLIWILDRATPEERRNFFAQIPERLYPGIRWFPYALAYKYGRTVDKRELRRRLALVNPARVRPPPNPVTVEGQVLATTEDLYEETSARLRQEMDCSDRMLAAAPSNARPADLFSEQN